MVLFRPALPDPQMAFNCYRRNGMFRLVCLILSFALLALFSCLWAMSRSHTFRSELDLAGCFIAFQSRDGHLRLASAASPSTTFGNKILFQLRRGHSPNAHAFGFGYERWGGRYSGSDGKSFIPRYHVFRIPLYAPTALFALITVTLLLKHHLPRARKGFLIDPSTSPPTDMQ